MLCILMFLVIFECWVECEHNFLNKCWSGLSILGSGQRTVLILDSRFWGETHIWGGGKFMHFLMFFVFWVFSEGGIWDSGGGGGEIPPRR